MKYLLVLFMLPSVANAKEFVFTYNLQEGNKVQTVKYKTNADTWKEAHDRGAQFCFNFFGDQKPFDEDWLMTVIDSCANPSTR